MPPPKLKSFIQSFHNNMWGTLQNDGKANEIWNNPQRYSLRRAYCRKRNLGRPQLRYRNVCKRDMRELSIDKNKCEKPATKPLQVEKLFASHLKS